ncbi:unnamed protein product [Rotaria sordida]|uniref:Uncharacterized protein n=1 Tax=Rotaria sordida TaxID=392033 RepID=A0A813NKX0_9BILA|nr:unnamed protein product [Rotaria sordida]CAF0753420.1 unnamed protein product [Rotaria sordida]
MTNHLLSRSRRSSTYVEVLPIEKEGRSRRGFSLELPLLKNDYIIDHFHNEELIEAINKIKKENEKIRLENLLYSRYLRRVNSSNIIETYDQYANENDIIEKELYVNSNENILHSKVPKVARRLSMEKNSVDTSNTKSLWTKLIANLREATYAPLLLRIKQEKLFIAAYEIEHTRLDWKRMEANSILELDQLDVLLRTAESDEITEEKLNNDVKKHINKFQYDFSKDKLNNKRLIVPADILISRINKQIEKHKRLIDSLHIDTECAQVRIRTIEKTMQDLDNLHEKMDEIDINFARTKRIDYRDTYTKLEKQYTMNKSSQYPLIHNLQEWKAKLSEQEQLKIDYQYKCDLFENYLELLNNEISCIKYENELILNENNFLKDRIADIKKVPTITEYAYTIEQTKKLKHEIDIWTQRVNIAEVSFHIENQDYFL